MGKRKWGKTEKSPNFKVLKKEPSQIFLHTLLILILGIIIKLDLMTKLLNTLFPPLVLNLIDKCVFSIGDYEKHIQPISYDYSNLYLFFLF